MYSMMVVCCTATRKPFYTNVNKTSVHTFRRCVRKVGKVNDTKVDSTGKVVVRYLFSLINSFVLSTVGLLLNFLCLRPSLPPHNTPV